MNIFDKIQEKKAKFQKIQRERQDKNLLSMEEKTARLKKETAVKKAFQQAKEENRKVKASGSFLKGFSNTVKANIDKRSKQSNNGVGNIFTAQSNAPNNTYTGANPFVLGNPNNNPYSFSGSRLPKKVKQRKNKQIIIRL